ncbi:MAG: hypothetical protein RLZZ511_3586 [Cyanobacteriota bacterium]|jgi:LmbE family N-acetylglucosaminyl deacetylase
MKLSWQRRMIDQLQALHVDFVIGLIKLSGRLQPNRWQFKVTDRPMLVFAPHQDDETFGCGGLIALKRSRQIPVRVVFLTHGDPDHDPGETTLVKVRETEALDALALLGVAADQVQFLRYPDGQLPQLPQYRREILHQQLVTLLPTNQPWEIFVPHAQDAHGDHEATYAFVQAAIAQLPQSHFLYQYPIWIFRKLLVGVKFRQFTGWQGLDIRAVISQKRAAMAAHASQTEALPPGFYRRFARPEELFYRG